MKSCDALKFPRRILLFSQSEKHHSILTFNKVVISTSENESGEDKFARRRGVWFAVEVNKNILYSGRIEILEYVLSHLSVFVRPRGRWYCVGVYSTGKMRKNVALCEYRCIWWNQRHDAVNDLFMLAASRCCIVRWQE